MRIELTGSDEIRAAFAALVPRVQDNALAKLAVGVHQDVIAGADAHTKTGALVQSIRLRRIAEGWQIGHDLQRAPYAPFVHWGAKPHDIEPNKRKVLRWATDGKVYKPSDRGDFFLFAKIVHHPGYKGDPYMVRAVEAAPIRFARIITELQRTI